MKTYWRLLGFAKPIEKYAIPYFFFTLFHALFNAATMIVLMPVISTLFRTENMLLDKVEHLPAFAINEEYFRALLNFILYKLFGTDYDIMSVLILLAIMIFVCAFFSNLFRYLGQRTMENMKIRTLYRIRNSVFDNVMGLQAGFFSNERKGDIISKITSDVQVVQYCISNTLQVAFRDPFLIIAYLAVLTMMSWELTIFSVLFLPVAAFAIGFIVKKLRRKATKGQEAYSEMVSTLDESLSGVKVIKSYRAEGYVEEKFHGINGLYSRIMRSMAKRQQLSSPMSEFLGITALAVLLLYGGNLVLKGSIGAAAFLTYIGIFSQVTRPVRSFADAFANINQGIAAGERVLELLDTQSTIKDKPDAVSLGEFSDSIEFRDVHFSYENKEVIRGVDMTIRRGETVALVGPSGGGKSTLSDLIPRFYDVQKGAVLVDGHDVKDVSLASLRENIGVVSQDTVLFNDTIEGNIRMGKRDATMEEIVAAAKVANAHSFIMETEDGYQTNIGDRGMKLSGGQRQRLSIARAVLKNPAILILDEATSALDTESEKLVQQALDSLLEGRTSVVIAHRLSTIANADRIFVVEEGRITEQGTHEELMQKNGTYCKLVEMQHVS